MSYTFGEKIKVTLFGQSHGEAMGAVIDGIPAGFEVDFEKLREFMLRRAPGGKMSTQRKETDEVKIISGIFEGKTCGAPLCGIIENKDVIDSDYDKLKLVPRPSHADYPAFVKYGGFNDYRGGGALSGRITAPLCFAGGIILQLLEKQGIGIKTEICEIGEKKNPNEEDIEKIISGARAKGDSVGGKIRCTVTGVPAGKGSPIFEGLDSVIAHSVFAVPGIKGIEFGETLAYGGLNNDAYKIENGSVITKSNRQGGMAGGISNGMPVVFTCTVKPAPSIAIEQNSVDLSTNENVKLTVGGRHDPCILPRVMPAIEAAVALALIQEL